MAPKTTLTPEQIKSAKMRIDAGDITVTAAAAELGIHQSNLSRALAKNSNNTQSSFDRLPHNKLIPDPHQPRRTFDEDSLDELAKSIAQRGLLQNLVVKPANDHGFYQITAGERRWRAIGRLIEEGLWHDDIPCRIYDGDEIAQRAASIVENLQRVDVPPLEEAQALADLQDLDPDQFTPTVLAEMIGKTNRFVQQRLALTRKLHPAAQRFLRLELITIEGARHLTSLSQADQIEALTPSIDPDWQFEFASAPEMPLFSDERVRTSMQPIASVDIAGEVSYIQKRNEREAQAAKDRARAQEDMLAQADSESPSEPTPASAKQVPENGKKPKTRQIENETMLSDEPDALPIPEPAGPPVTKNHIYHAHRRKSQALRAAIAGNPTTALRIACLALLTSTQDIALISKRPFYGDKWVRDDDPGESHEIEKTIEKYVGKLEPHWLDDKKRLKLWKKLDDLPFASVQVLFSALIARQVVTAAGHECRLGDSPLALAVAKSLPLAGHEENYGLALSREDLTGVRKQTLLGLADKIGTPGINDATKSADLVVAIAKTETDYVFPTLRFASQDEIDKQLQALSK